MHVQRRLFVVHYLLLNNMKRLSGFALGHRVYATHWVFAELSCQPGVYGLSTGAVPQMRSAAPREIYGTADVAAAVWEFDLVHGGGHVSMIAHF
jgi:hypothetical protein